MSNNLEQMEFYKDFIKSRISFKVMLHLNVTEVEKIYKNNSVVFNNISIFEMGEKKR